MGLAVVIAETKRFELDCALYGFDSKSKARALEQLKADPVIGKQRRDKPLLWEWRFGQFDITYAISSDFSQIALLELRPATAERTEVMKRVWDTIDKINKLKRLFGL